MKPDPKQKGSSRPDSQPHEATLFLVQRLRRKEPDAAVELNRLYREPLLRFCVGYLNQVEEAEDAVQDITCKVLAAGDLPDQFRPWLYKIARNHCLNLLRTRVARKDRAALPSPSQLADALTGHLTRLAKDEVRGKLSEKVLSLPDSQREVLRLRYVEDLSRAEIAEVLEIPESTVKTRLFEVMKKLRDYADELEHGSAQPPA